MCVCVCVQILERSTLVDYEFQDKVPAKVACATHTEEHLFYNSHSLFFYTPAPSLSIFFLVCLCVGAAKQKTNRNFAVAALGFIVVLVCSCSYTLQTSERGCPDGKTIWQARKLLKMFNRLKNQR